MSQEKGEAAKGGSVIGNLLEVLRCFTLHEPLLGVTEIAAKVGLHKSSVSRILSNLEDEHIVERDAASRKYRLGAGLIDVAGPLLAGLDVRRIAYPLLGELVADTQETVVLASWNGTWATCVEQLPSPRLIKHTSPLGHRYTTGASASVQVFLAAEPAERVARLVGDGSISLPTGLDLAAYLRKLGEVREAGVAVNDGATSQDELGVAAPVVDHRGQVCAAVLLAAPRYRVQAADVAELAARTAACARAVSVRLGYVPEGVAELSEPPTSP